MQRRALQRITASAWIMVVGPYLVASTAVCQTERFPGQMPGTRHATGRAVSPIPAPSVADVGPVSSISRDNAVAVARRWLEALKTKDSTKVAEQTLWPFTFKS